MNDTPAAGVPSMGLIEEFIGRYYREFDFYDQVARLAAQQLEVLIQAGGIRAIVTARAKQPVRLEAKVRQRNSQQPYATIDDVYTPLWPF
jgi:ppGpp synthetase/RelA/SpoT-type nucleotidyltranferase